MNLSFAVLLTAGQGSAGKYAPEGKSYPEPSNKNPSIVEHTSPVDVLANKQG